MNVSPRNKGQRFRCAFIVVAQREQKNHKIFIKMIKVLGGCRLFLNTYDFSELTSTLIRQDGQFILHTAPCLVKSPSRHFLQNE